MTDVHIRNPRFIRERRTALGLTQRQVALAIGYDTHAIVADIENGRRDWLAQDAFTLLAKTLDVSHEELLAAVKSCPENPMPRTAREFDLADDGVYVRRIESATDEDAELFVRLHARLMPEHVGDSEMDLTRWLVRRTTVGDALDRRFLVVRRGSRLVGFLHLDYDTKGNFALVNSFGVEPSEDGTQERAARLLFLKAVQLLQSENRQCRGVLYELADANQRSDALRRLFRRYAHIWGTELAETPTHAHTLFSEYVIPKVNLLDPDDHEIAATLEYVPIRPPYERAIPDHVLGELRRDALDSVTRWYVEGYCIGRSDAYRNLYRNYLTGVWSGVLEAERKRDSSQMGR
jgi:transcriptional regulator with XRE-family HTH domain